MANRPLSELLAQIQDVTEFVGEPLREVNQRGSFGNTPLKVAVVWGDEQAVLQLLTAGADPNARGEDGQTPLHHAAAGNHVAIALQLLAHGASDDLRDDEENRPSDLAKVLGYRAMVDALASGTASTNGPGVKS